MSTQTRSTYQAQLSGTYFPDNTTELISEADVRNSLTNLSDSAVFKRDDAYLRVEDVTTGTQPAYVVTLTNEYPTAYNERVPILFKAHATSTGAATLNVNSLGAKDILRPDGSATQSGDIIQDQFYMVNYDSGLDDFVIFPGFGGGATLAGLVTGPASSTDNAITRFDGTTGKLVQNSGATIDDSGNLSAVGGTFSGSLTTSENTYTQTTKQGILVRSSNTAGSGNFGGGIIFSEVGGGFGANNGAAIYAKQLSADANETGIAISVHGTTSGDPRIERAVFNNQGLSITGSIIPSSLTGTATQLGGWTSGNVATTVTVGSGLNLDTGTGTLSASGGGSLLLSETTITSAQFKSINSTPQTLISAPGADQYILVHAAVVSMDFNSIAYTSGGNVQIQYITSGVSFGFQAGYTASTDWVRRYSDQQSVSINEGLQLTTDSSDPGSGNSDIKVKIWYTIESL